MSWLQKLSQHGKLVFYHGSRANLPVGTVLTARSEGYARSPETQIEEQKIEKYRPPDKISRQEAVFLSDDIDNIDGAGGYLDYVYEVEPIGKVERSDLGWYSQMSVYGAHNNHPEDEAEWAKNYWAGVPYPEGSNFEYRCRSARIIRLVETNV